MPRVLLFLPLLILSRATAVSIITPGLADGDRALLAELAGLAEPIPAAGTGGTVPDPSPRHPPRLLPAASAAPRAGPCCHDPGAAQGRLCPPGRGRGAGAGTGAGHPHGRRAAAGAGAVTGRSGPAAAGPAAPQPGAEPGGLCLCGSPHAGHGAHATPRAGTAGNSRGSGRAAAPCGGAGEDEDACSPPGEREAHRVLDWVPGVSIFYNLGTSVYFAFQGCEATASTRALEAAEDLGYAGLAALTGGLGGPVAMGVQLGLQPGLKAGVRALIGYFTSPGEPSPVPTAHSGAVVIV